MYTIVQLLVVTATIIAAWIALNTLTIDVVAYQLVV